MRIGDLLTARTVIIDVRAANKPEALAELSGRAEHFVLLDRHIVFRSLLDRESAGSTGLGMGAAMPHARFRALRNPFALFARLGRPIDFHALDDRPVDLVLLLLGPEPPTPSYLDVLVSASQSLRGLAFGMALSWIVIRLMKTLDDFAVEVSLSIALAMGSYAVAQALHLSGAITVVGAGMLFGGTRAKEAMAGVTEVYLTGFWTLVDEILNALLFLLLGVEMIAVPFYAHQLSLLIAVIPLVLIARFAVVLPWGSYFRFRHAERRPTLILGWGGLHGALSLALALSLPAGPERALILSITYAVVAFSVAAQGLTFTSLVRWTGVKAP
jgi:NhaP-type Na+/H+ or K+/H+ antiporter